MSRLSDSLAANRFNNRLIDKVNEMYEAGIITREIAAKIQHVIGMVKSTLDYDNPEKIKWKW